eukprot:g9331.t1
MLSHKNYTRELQSMPKFLRENADYTDTQEIESQAKPLQLIFCLKKRQGFTIHRHLAEAGPSAWLDRLGCYFAEPRDSMANQYCVTHDYSTVRKSHTVGTYVFYPEDLSEATDVSECVELCGHPLPMQVAETNPLTDGGVVCRASKYTTTALLNNLRTTFGSKTVENTLRDPRLRMRDIDIEVWTPPAEQEGGLLPRIRLPLQCHLLCDQGSPELRMIQLVLEWLPGIAKEPPFHRLSNNMKNLAPPICLAASAIRSCFMGPFGTGANQGAFRNSLSSLKQEAADNPSKTSTRKYAAEVIDAFPGESMSQILEKGVDLISHWFWCILPLFLFALEPLIDADTKKKKTEKKEQDLRQLQELEVNVDAQYEDDGDNVPISFLELDADEKEMLGKDWDGSTAKLRGIIVACKREHRAAQRDLGASHSDLCDLLDAITSKAGNDPATFATSTTLKRAQKYLGPDLNSQSTLATPQLQERLQKNRMHILQCMCADIFKQLGKSETHEKSGLHLVRKVANLAGWQLWDPIFGLWESVAEKRIPFLINADNVEKLEESLTYDLSVFAKRSGRCLIEVKRHWLTRMVRLPNQCYPVSEKLQEQQFKDEKKNKEKASAGATIWTKLLQRLEHLKRQPRYHLAPTVTRSERTNLLPTETVVDEAMLCRLEHNTNTSNIDRVLEQLEKDEIGKHPQKNHYLTSRLMGLKEDLMKAWNKQLPEDQWPEKFEKVVDHVGNHRTTTSAAHTLGSRGVEACAVLKNNADAFLADFLRNSGRNVVERKNVAAKIKESGGVLMQNPVDQVWVWVCFVYMGIAFGIQMVKGAPRTELTFPTVPKQCKFDADFFAKWHSYDGQIGISENDLAWGSAVMLAFDPSKIITSQQMQGFHFPHTSLERQLRMLRDVSAKHPALTKRILEKMSNGARSRVFDYFHRSGELSSNIVSECVRRYGNSVRVLALDGEVWDDQVAEERLERLEAAAGTESGPRVHKPHSPGKTPASGIRRLPAQVVVNMWNLSASPPVLCAQARSHRTNFGAGEEKLRLHWPPKYRPPVENTERVLLPRVLKEYNLKREQVSLVKTEEEWDIDEEIFVNDYYDEPPDQEEQTQSKTRKRTATIAKVHDKSSKDSKDPTTPKGKKQKTTKGVK